MDIIHPAIQQYAEAHSNVPFPILNEIEQFTKLSHPKQHMLSGHLQGNFLYMLSMMVRPMYVLEIGTFTGYSAVCLSGGLRAGGMVHSIESREEEVATAEGFIKKAGLETHIQIHLGEAKEVIPTLDFPWDIVFIDADKTGYIQYVDLVMGRLKPGGWIIADNVFFHGGVIDEQNNTNNVKAIKDFNNYILEMENVDKCMLTLRDGLYIIRKKM